MVCSEHHELIEIIHRAHLHSDVEVFKVRPRRCRSRHIGGAEAPNHAVLYRPVTFIAEWEFPTAEVPTVEKRHEIPRDVLDTLRRSRRFVTTLSHSNLSLCGRLLISNICFPGRLRFRNRSGVRRTEF